MVLRENEDLPTLLGGLTGLPDNRFNLGLAGTEEELGGLPEILVLFKLCTKL